MTAQAIQQRFGTAQAFLQMVNPDVQTSFAQKPEVCITGQYPTLQELNECYGRTFAATWLVPQLADLTLFTGARNLSEKQQEQLARMIAAEQQGLKVTEVMLFFYRFKTGRYGRFYGNVDPLMVMTALQDFLKERREMAEACREQQERDLTEAMEAAADEVRRTMCRLAGADYADIYCPTVDPYRRRLRFSVISAEVARSVLSHETEILGAALPLLPPDTTLSIYMNTHGGAETALKWRENENTCSYPTEGGKTP